jgi:head-tail adaptor
MQSGDLKHRIALEAQTRVPDGGGSFTVTWVAVPGCTNLAAAKWPIKSSEAFEGGRTVSIADYRMRIRYRRIFKSSWRVKDLFTNTYMSIVSKPIDIGDSHVWLEFLVKETTS